MKPRICIVAAHFPPSNLIGARRPALHSAGLAARGWEVEVLTTKDFWQGEVFERGTPPPGVVVHRTNAVLPGALFRKLRKQLRGGGAGGSPSPGPGGSGPRSRSAAKSVLHQFEFPDAWRGWLPFAARHRGRADVVLATLPPYTPALVAMELTAAGEGARLVLDYRDPWWDSATLRKRCSSAELERHRQLEDRCLQRADLVIGVSKSICKALERRASCPVEWIPNAFEPTDEATSPAEDPRIVVYAGALGYNRTLAPVLQAMARTDNDLELHVVGHPLDPVRQQAEELGVSDRVVLGGRVPWSEARALLTRSSAAIVLVSPETAGQIPGKIFEILALDKPVLLVGPRGDAFELVEEHGLGWAHELDDIDGLGSTLRAIGSGARPSTGDATALRADNVLDRLDSVLRSAL